MSTDILNKIGFTEEEAKLVTENLIDAELAKKKSHGLALLPYLNKNRDRLNLGDIDLDIISQTADSIHIDGHGKLGFSIIYKSLDLAFEMANSSRVVCVGLKDMSISGYIGSYARKATEKDLIFIGFNSSSGGLIPYGAKKAVWGTNPLTVGIPTRNIPVILDMASSQITWGDILVAIDKGEEIREGTALDSQGKVCTDPDKVMKGGGLLPFSGHKGSGLAFIVSLLGGALTGSGVGYNVPGGWGSFYILIDPSMFRPVSDFKKDVATAVDELKRAPKMAGFEEIYFAGEQSFRARQEQLKKGEIEIDEDLYRSLVSVLENKELIT